MEKLVLGHLLKRPRPSGEVIINRERGTIELKSVKVTRDVCRDYLVDKVIPAIQDKWPDDDMGTTIYIQQDNAKPHVLSDDPVFREVVDQTDLDIRLLQ